MNFDTRKTVLFLLSACYLLYPVWAVPLPGPAQWLLFNALLVFSLLTARAYRALPVLAAPAPAWEEWKVALPVLALFFAAALPFWLLPIPVSCDEQSHAGPAAVLLSKFLPGLAARAAAAALALAGLALLLLRALRPGAAGRLPAIVYCLGLNAWFFLFLKSGVLAAAGKWETLLRYPPLPKLLYLALYTATGIHEWAPRAAQAAFVAAAALVLYKIARLFSEKATPAFSVGAAVFFPTFFNLALWAEIEGGTIFFFAAAIYFFLKALKETSIADMWRASLLLCFGMMYRQLVLGLILAMLALLLWLWAAEKQRRPFYLACAKSLFPALASGLPFLLISGFTGVRDSGLDYAILTDLGRMTASLAAMPLTLGWPVFSLTMASVVYVFYKYRSRELWAFFALSAAYYFMISGTGAAGYIRHVQPFYLFPVFCAVLAGSDLLAAVPLRAARFVLGAGLILTSAYAAVLADHPYQRKTWGNRFALAYPYDQAAAWLAKQPAPLRVYAPMEVEPANFYLAKHYLLRKIYWDRAMPMVFSAKELDARAGGFDYLLLPAETIPGLKFSFTAAVRELTAAYGYAAEQTFDFHGNKLLLLRKAAKTSGTGRQGATHVRNTRQN